MGTIVDATLPAEQLALGETLEAVPAAEFEAVCTVAHRTDAVVPFVRASAPDAAALEDALAADPTTEGVARLAAGEENCLYWVQWSPPVRSAVRALVCERGTLLDAAAAEGRWELCVLFPEHDDISATYDTCSERGLELTIRRSKELTDLSHPGVVDLSEEQHEALTTAFESDYYQVPRGTTLEELAEHLGVSHQALSERLRRGHRCLIENVLADGREPAVQEQ